MGVLTSEIALKLLPCGQYKLDLVTSTKYKMISSIKLKVDLNVMRFNKVMLVIQMSPESLEMLGFYCY